MLGRHEVGMSPLCFLRRQFEHLWMQRRNQDRDLFLRRNRPVHRTLQLGQVLLHVTVRLRIAVTAIRDRRLMAHAYAKYEAPSGKLSNGIRCGANRERMW